MSDDSVLRARGGREETPLNGTEGDEGDNSNVFASALDVNNLPTENSSLAYFGKAVRSSCVSPNLTWTGDKQGLGGFVFDICNPGDSQRGTHYLVPRASTKVRRPEDLAYLRIKGAFSMPSGEVCDELVRCYFHHVHQFLPIINAQSFLEQYVRHGCQNVSLLLLWSMFFAAANVGVLPSPSSQWR